MSAGPSTEYLASLVRELCALPREAEWVEFKVDRAEPREIGEYISALANAAALVGKAFAYLVWGIHEVAHKDLKDMDKADRVRACYLHACLCYVTRKAMTNTTLRERFGVAEHNRSLVSRLIREAVEAGVVVPADPDAAPKLMRYLPFWAGPGRDEGDRDT